jgi:hypothetical protein
MKRLQFPVKLLVIILLAATMLATGCTAQQSVAEPAAAAKPLAAAELLAAATLPQLDNNEVLHAQWIFEELEALPPGSQQPQMVRKTTDLWAESAPPWRYRFKVTAEPGGLAYDSGWNGERLWEFNVENDERYALVRPPEPDEIPTLPLDPARFANPYPDLLMQAQQSPERLQNLGMTELSPWGKVHIIGYAWDGVTAQTVRYTGYPHTLYFYISEANQWLVEWKDVIHADEGDVVARHYQLTAWEALDSATIPGELWTFVPPESVIVVDALPEPEEEKEEGTAVTEAEPTRKIGEWEVPDYGYTPWIVESTPTLNLALAGVRAAHGQYILSYELNGQPTVVLAQGLELNQQWGNEPEKVELPWATVELGAIEPMGPPGWVALIRPSQNQDVPQANVSLLVENPDQELVFEIIEALAVINQ